MPTFRDRLETQKKINMGMKSRWPGNKFQQDIPGQFEEELVKKVMQNDKVEKQQQEYYGLLGRSLDHYSAQVSKLKTNILGQSIIQFAPIIPIAKGAMPISVEAMRESGIIAIDAAGFKILENQILMGINFKNLASGDAPLESYRRQCSTYLEKIHELNDKLGELTQAELELKDIDNELDFIEENKTTLDPGGDKESIESGRENRKRYLVNARPALVKKVEQLKVHNNDDITALTELEAEYKTFKANNRPDSVNLGGDFAKKLLEFAKQCQQQINKQLNEDERIEFMTHTFILHGNIAYYWMMKHRMLDKWIFHVGGLMNSLKEWTFPQKERPAILKKVDKEIKQTQTFTEECIKLKKLGMTIEQAEKKLKIFLIKHQMVWDDYHADMFKKIWSEADEVIKERDAEKSSSVIHKGKLASSILRKNNWRCLF